MIFLIVTFIFIFGLIIGSFLNCLIWRLHAGEGMWNRSYCPKCRQQIVWYDNIPLLSFILLRGKCRKCGQSISWQYPAVEFITGALFVISFYLNYESRIMNQEYFNLSVIHDSLFMIQVLRDWLLIAVMTVIFIYDLRWYLILDIVTLPAIVIMTAVNLFLGFDWQNLLISGIIGAGFFLSQFVISKGKWIGGGDIRLGLLMGVSLGYPSIVLALFLAYIIGSIISVGLVIRQKKGWKSQIPFGIFLSTASIITLFWGEKIIAWYLGLIAY